LDSRPSPQISPAAAWTKRPESQYRIIAGVAEKRGLTKMLPSDAKRAVGAYQYAVMIAVTGLGFVGAPWWMVLIAAALLFGSTLFEYADIQARAVTVNATVVAGSAVVTVAVMSIGFAITCYLGGYGLASLIRV
jgi:hypothetical protein